MADKKIIDAAPVITKLAERALQAKGRECSLLGEVIDMLRSEPEVKDAPYWATEAAYKNGFEAGKLSRAKWIPVTERLPEDSVAVNLHTKSGVVGTGFYDKHTKSWVQWYSGGSCSVDVTHWMPLPTPPEEVK